MDWMRSIMTVVAFFTFIGIVLWAWSARKQGDFERAAHSVLNEDTPQSAPVSAPGARHE